MIELICDVKTDALLELEATPKHLEKAINEAYSDFKRNLDIDWKSVAPVHPIDKFKQEHKLPVHPLFYPDTIEYRKGTYGGTLMHSLRFSENEKSKKGLYKFKFSFSGAENPNQWPVWNEAMSGHKDYAWNFYKSPKERNNQDIIGKVVEDSMEEFKDNLRSKIMSVFDDLIDVR